MAKEICFTGFPFNPPADEPEGTLYIGAEVYIACVNESIRKRSGAWTSHRFRNVSNESAKGMSAKFGR